MTVYIIIRVYIIEWFMLFSLAWSQCVMWLPRDLQVQHLLCMVCEHQQCHVYQVIIIVHV